MLVTLCAQHNHEQFAAKNYSTFLLGYPQPSEIQNDFPLFVLQLCNTVSIVGCGVRRQERGWLAPIGKVMARE